MTRLIGLFSETSLAGVRDVHTYYRELGRQIVLGDQWGFDFFSATQSYGLDYPDSTFSVTPDPLALFASQIATTRRIRILSGILVAPFHHPAMALCQAAAIDVMSAGRVMLGLGRGHPWLYDRLGFDQSESRPRFEEFCAMTRAILDAPQARHTLTGRFWRTVDFQLLPEFVHGRPPVYLAQVGGPPSIDLAVKHGFGMLVPSYLGLPLEQVTESIGYYNDHFRRQWGRDGEILVGVQIYAHADSARARAIGARALARQLGVFGRNLTQMMARGHAHYPAYKPLGEFFTRMSDVSVCSAAVESEWPRYLSVWGTPDECLRKFETLVGRLGPQDLILNIDAGGLSAAEVEAGMTCVGRDVLPGLRELLDRSRGMDGGRRSA